MSEQRYKCQICYHILKDEDLIEGNCPECNITPEKMCIKDKICECPDDITGGSQVCDVCGEYICPCGSHSASVISRITGYMSELAGWNSGKKEEHKNRVHYDVLNGGKIL